MSARDDLLNVFDAGGCNDPCFTFEEVADRILNAHAHELAEQIRAQKGSGTYEPGVYFRGGMDYGADLIDPQASASAGPVRPDEEPTT